MNEITREELDDYKKILDDIVEEEVKCVTDAGLALKQDIKDIQSFVDAHRKLFCIPAKEDQKNSIAYWEAKVNEKKKDCEFLEVAESVLTRWLGMLAKKQNELLEEAERHLDAARNQKTNS